jgi:hypothetical protein
MVDDDNACLTPPPSTSASTRRCSLDTGNRVGDDGARYHDADSALSSPAKPFGAVGTYGWALNEPMRKLYYNMSATFIAIVAAVAVSGIELLGLVQAQTGLTGWFKYSVGTLNDKLEMGRYLITGFLASLWIGWAIVHWVRAHKPVALKL